MCSCWLSGFCHGARGLRQAAGRHEVVPRMLCIHPRSPSWTGGRRHPASVRGARTQLCAWLRAGSGQRSPVPPCSVLPPSASQPASILLPASTSPWQPPSLKLANSRDKAENT